MASEEALHQEIARLRQALEVSDRQFRAIFHSAQDAMVVLDDAGHYVDVNAAACALYGRPREEVLGARVGDFSAPPDAQDAWSTLGEQGKGQWHVVRPDGSRHEVEFAASEFAAGRRFAVIRDVTERKLAEDVLRSSEERFRALVENSSDAILLVTGEGTVLFRSEAADRILGYAPGERLGRNGFEIVHPGDLARVRKAFGEVLARPGMPVTLEFRAARNDGTWRHVVGVGTNRLDEPAVAAVVINYRDVTESKHAEEQLRRSESRLRAVLDAALDGVIGMDADGLITYWNPRAEAIFGWKRTEALGKRLRELIIPERYRDAHTRGLARFLATGEGPVLDRRIEIQGLRRDGTEFPVELSITSLKEGDAFSFSAFVADVTDRQRAEVELRRYADVFRNMQVGVNVWCLQNREDLRSFKLISTNPAAVHSLGVRTEDILGKRMDEAFPHMLDTDLPRLYREVVLSGEGRDLGEVSALHSRIAPDGVFSAKVFPLPGDCVGVAFENITERRRLEEQLRQSQRLEAVGSLAGGIAHDFNNLLSVILGQTELLGRGMRAGDPGLPRVEEIRKAGERAALLTRQLLAFSRKQVLIPEVLDPGTVVADLATMLRRLIGEDIVLRTAIGRDTAAVTADRGQIEQVIVNLVVNARDAMPEGGTIDVEVRNADLDAAYAASHPPTVAGPYVMIAVSDTGTGMDAATRARVFEPFFTTKEKGKGTGLGLTTVYGIVKQSRGYVWLDSEPGKGANFQIYLPRLEGVSATPTAADSRPAPPLPGTETVLLVEDEGMLRELAREVLEASGYRVLQAAGGEDALRVAGAHQGTIHLLLTDVVMPGISGRVVAERLAGSRPEMKVLYTSGYTDDAVLQRGVLTEGTAFIQKPFTTEALVRKVREVLDSDARAAADGDSLPDTHL